MSHRIDYTSDSDLESGLHILAALGGGPAHRFEIDTGSVGILVPRSVLGPAFQDFDPNQDIDFGFVSSGKSYKGQWVKVPVIIGLPDAWDGTGDFPTADIEVFAVDTPVDFVSGMFGIGFAIGGKADGGPSRNPLLNLSYRGKGLARSYIVGLGGIDVGLRNIGADRFSLVALSQNADGSDWQQPTGTLGLGNRVVHLPVLMDTGISRMLLFMPKVELPTDLGPDSLLPAGVSVSINLDGPDGGALAYTFVTGESIEPMAPSDVQCRVGHGINTGRNVLASNDYLFDAEGGQIGFRAR